MEKLAKMRPFLAKTGRFEAKKGQKPGFAVTDSLTDEKCKLLISCKLITIEGPKNDFHKVGGGQVDFRGRNGEKGLENRDQKLGTRDWDCARWGLYGGHRGLAFAIVLLCAACGKLSASTCGAAKGSLNARKDFLA
jgi:hypothetical protein